MSHAGKPAGRTRRCRSRCRHRTIASALWPGHASGTTGIRHNKRSAEVNCSARESWIGHGVEIPPGQGTSLGESVVAEVKSSSAASVVRPTAVTASPESRSSKIPAGWLCATWMVRSACPGIAPPQPPDSGAPSGTMQRPSAQPAKVEMALTLRSGPGPVERTPRRSKQPKKRLLIPDRPAKTAAVTLTGRDAKARQRLPCGLHLISELTIGESIAAGSQQSNRVRCRRGAPIKGQNIFRPRIAGSLRTFYRSIVTQMAVVNSELLGRWVGRRKRGTCKIRITNR